MAKRQIKGFRCLKCNSELTHVVGTLGEEMVCRHELEESIQHRKRCGGAIEVLDYEDDNG